MHVALLRSVNLGKQRKVSMAALRALFADLGYPGARTYIQSGNVVFAAPGEDEAALAVKLRAAIEAMTGFEVAVVVRSAAAWEEAVRACPFDPGVVSVAAAFLGAEPRPEGLAALRSRDFGAERWTVVGRTLYQTVPDGVKNVRLSHALIERQLGCPATVRNWRTVLAVGEMLRPPAG